MLPTKSTSAVNLLRREPRPPDPDVAVKLRGMLLIRLVVSVIIFLSGPIFFKAHAFPLYLFTSALFFLTLVYLFLLKFQFDPKLFANLQIFADAVLVTVLISLTGWEDSTFSFLYIIPIITTSLFFHLRESISVALLCSILYAVAVFFGRYGLPSPPWESNIEMFYSLYIRAIIFCMVGYLCGRLANVLKRQKEELGELRNLHDLIISSMNSGLITTDTENNIIYANPAAEQILGFSLSKMYNKNLGDFFVDQEGSSFRGGLKDHFARAGGDEGLQPELQARTAEGKNISIGFSVSPIQSDCGRPVGKVMVFSDLTEVMELERRLRAIDKLRAAGELAAGIAHEIRNPLTSITASIEMLAESPDLSETNRDLLSVILKESARLNRIIEDFLAYARRGNLNMKKEDLCEIIKESVEILERGGKLSQDVHVELVTPSERAIVSADRSQMSQVFLNLLTNAVDAMEGSGTISVTVEAPTENNDNYSVTITDTGRGMSVEQLSRVFEPFFTTKKRGGGIGLCIAEKIVREHNGHVQIVSEEGKGTSATVVIPREQSELQRQPQGETAGSSEASIGLHGPGASL